MHQCGVSAALVNVGGPGLLLCPAAFARLWGLFGGGHESVTRSRPVRLQTRWQERPLWPVCPSRSVNEGVFALGGRATTVLTPVPG